MTTAKTKAPTGAEPGPVEPKAGLVTTEFWLTALLVLCATVLRLANTISDEMWAATVVPPVGAYTLSRAYMKKG